MIKNLPENVSGRDFVVGDLHGCFELLCSVLTFVDFDPEKDRLISVGDLVDRGPDSLKCLQLLDEPWFHCVKGNHEQLMEDFLTGGPTGAWWMRNGGGWYNDLEPTVKKVVETYIPDIQALPLLITVEGPKKFHVLHAELHALRNTHILDSDLESEDRFTRHALAHMGDGDAVLWGRELWGTLYGAFIDDRKVVKLKRSYAMNPSYFNDDLAMIYSGHTTMRQPTVIGGQTNLDTGAFRANRDDWAGLTMTEPLTNRFWTIKKDGVHSVEPLIIV